MKCEMCKKSLVPIGTSRKGGKCHNDWSDRKLHKKCWMKKQEMLLLELKFTKNQ